MVRHGAALVPGLASLPAVASTYQHALWQPVPPDGVVTVMAAVPLLPPLAAVIVAGPAATPVTSPLVLTVATELVLVLHVTARPLSGFPAESRGVAVSCTLLPTATPAVAGVTLTVLTGTSITVTAAVPLLPPLVAVIVAEPAETPVTSPLVLTAATELLLVLHVTARPLSGFPAESCGVAVSCTVLPAATLAVAGVTPTVATGTSVTVTMAVPLLPPLVAEIVALPAPTPVTRPTALTLATPLLLLVQVTVRPLNGFPAVSWTTTLNWAVLPTLRLAVGGLTSTAPTGGVPGHRMLTLDTACIAPGLLVAVTE